MQLLARLQPKTKTHDLRTVRRRALPAVAAVLAVVAWAYASFSESYSNGDSLLTHEGIGVVLLMSIPVWCALITLVDPRPENHVAVSGWMTAITVLFVLLGFVTVGILFTPCAVVMIGNFIDVRALARERVNTDSEPNQTA